MAIRSRFWVARQISGSTPDVHVDRLGWCTNVLSASTVASLLSQLDEVSASLPAATPIGLWLPASMLQEDLGPLRQWLVNTETSVLGLNAFPIDAFHAPIVKCDVYRPHWADSSRLTYTLAAGQALASLLPDGGSAGLSTVPIGWPDDDIDSNVAASNIRAACTQLADLSKQTGKDIHLAIEPEPGCVVSTAADLARFVESYKLGDLARDGLLRACLDACHLAVMHESAGDAVSALASADITIGRLQLSSAPEADSAADLAELAEPRWLHQTTLMRDGTCEFFSDIPEAIDDDAPNGLWRTHLHVPIHLTHLGDLRTTQSVICDLLAATVDLPCRPMLEVETYAWSALPADARAPSLGEDIAAELAWANHAIKEAGW